jgi:hypothetical protein
MPVKKTTRSTVNICCMLFEKIPDTKLVKLSGISTKELSTI